LFFFRRSRHQNICSRKFIHKLFIITENNLKTEHFFSFFYSVYSYSGRDRAEEYTQWVMFWIQTLYINIFFFRVVFFFSFWKTVKNIKIYPLNPSMFKCQEPLLFIIQFLMCKNSGGGWVDCIQEKISKMPLFTYILFLLLMILLVQPSLYFHFLEKKRFQSNDNQYCSCQHRIIVPVSC
jgi:hypothetical protein